jgi:hypothetical protein
MTSVSFNLPVFAIGAFLFVLAVVVAVVLLLRK